MNAQVRDQEYAKNLTQSLLSSINAINLKQLTPAQVQEYANGYIQSATNYLQNQPPLIDQTQYKQLVDAATAKINQAAQPASQPIAIPTVEISSPARPKGDGWTGPRIDPVFQTMLGVSADGKLGKMTQSALDVYKKSRNPGMSNELAFEYLKREPEYRARRPLPYDDNSNTYGSTANQIVRETPF